METPSQKNSKTRLIHGDVHQRICQLATQSRGNIISFLPAKKLGHSGVWYPKMEKVWKGEISCILPYLTISYHILPYLTTLFALLVGFELFYWGLLYLETKSNQTNVMSHANWFDDFESTEFMYLMILVVSKLATSSCQLESKCCCVWGSQGWPLGRLTYLRKKQPESTL